MGLGRLVPSAGWLGDFNTALPAVGVFGMWGQFGFCLILFLAGVMKIPASLYEAARVDGANAVREFFAVTLPGLRYELQVVLVLTVIGTLGTFDEIYVLTSGGPGHATTVPAYLVWQRMFLTGQVGSAAALGIILMLIVFAVTLRTQPPDGTGGRGVTTTTSRTQVTFNYLLIILCSMVAIYPLVGVFLASLYPAGDVDLAVWVRAPPDVRLAQLRHRVAGGEVRGELHDEHHRRGGDGAGVGRPLDHRAATPSRRCASADRRSSSICSSSG